MINFSTNISNISRLVWTIMIHQAFMVLQYNRFSQVFKSLVEYSKYSVWDNFGQAKSGHILLQDHGDKVLFKNIKIKEF